MVMTPSAAEKWASPLLPSGLPLPPAHSDGRMGGRRPIPRFPGLFLIDGGKTGEAGAHLKKGPPKGQKGGNAQSAPQKADLPIFSA